MADTKQNRKHTWTNIRITNCHPKLNTTKNIKNSADIAMDSFSIGDISDVFMTTLFKNTVDTSIDVSFTKDISANSNVSFRDFTLKINDVLHAIESVSINASGKVKLQISAT